MQALIIEVIILTYVHYCERRKEKLKFGGISVKRIGLSFFFLNSYNDYFSRTFDSSVPIGWIAPTFIDFFSFWVTGK